MAPPEVEDLETRDPSGTARGASALADDIKETAT